MRRYIDWALMVLAWDGLLPIVVVGVPALIRFGWPKNDGLHVAVNLLFPISAFLVRCVMAHRHYQSDAHYGWQGVLFVVAIFYLIFFETLLILFGEVANGVAASEWRAMGLMYLGYLAMVGLALFPLRADTSPADGIDDAEPPVWDT